MYRRQEVMVWAVLSRATMARRQMDPLRASASRLEAASALPYRGQPQGLS
jgi:hypothetical protein